MDSVKKELLKKHIEYTLSIFNILKENNLLDSQETLDWLDELNKISVLY